MQETSRYTFGEIVTVIGFALIKNKPGSEFWVYSRLSNEPEIKEVYPIFGEYSFLVKIEAKDVVAIGNAVINKIRNIQGVITTETLLELKLT